jgi:hypothetical protein
VLDAGQGRDKGRTHHNSMPIVYPHGLGLGPRQNRLVIKHLSSPSHLARSLCPSLTTLPMTSSVSDVFAHEHGPSS